ncbi:MAG: hypothetical protein R3264_15765, partial [Anaerolineae bacterium]|nr:hypothetical protein [Anaerolineae bacterium]
MKLKRLGSLNKITLLLSVSIVIWAIALSPISLAQEPSPFEIKIIPAADFAVRGEPFTYTVVISNVSESAIKDVAVQSVIPTGAIFSETQYTNTDWVVRKPKIGQTGIIRWATQSLVPPQEVVRFDLVVNLLPNEEELISQDYTIVVGSLDNVVTSTAGSVTKILQPTPTPTVTPVSTPTTVAPSPTIMPTPLSPTAISTIPATPPDPERDTSTQSSVSEREVEGLNANERSVIGWAGLTLIFLIFIVFGVFT